MSKVTDGEPPAMSQALIIRKGRNTLQTVAGDHKETIDMALAQYRSTLEMSPSGTDRNQCPGFDRFESSGRLHCYCVAMFRSCDSCLCLMLLFEVSEGSLRQCYRRDSHSRCLD